MPFHLVSPHVLKIVFLVAVVERANDPARVSGCKNAGQNVPGYNAAGADHAAFADGHPGANDCASANPNPIANGHGARKHLSAAPQIRMKRVAGYGNGNIGRKQYI